MPQQIQQTSLTQAKLILWQSSSLPLLQWSLLLQLNEVAQRPPNSNMANKELNVSLWAKEQGDNAPSQHSRECAWL